MKFVIIASACLPAAFAAALQQRQAPQLPNLESIFVEKCAGDLLSACPDEAAAVSPYLTGEAQELDIPKFIEIAQKLAKNKECKAALPPCAGSVVQESLQQLLDSYLSDS